MWGFVVKVWLRYFTMSNIEHWMGSTKTTKYIEYFHFPQMKCMVMAYCLVWTYVLIVGMVDKKNLCWFWCPICYLCAFFLTKYSWWLNSIVYPPIQSLSIWSITLVIVYYYRIFRLSLSIKMSSGVLVVKVWNFYEGKKIECSCLWASCL